MGNRIRIPKGIEKGNFSQNREIKLLAENDPGL
jgi:hypothetical protein